MGGQEAFAKVEATCTTWEATWLLLECASTQLDNSWQKHGQHMGSQKAFGSKLSFWPAGCWHLGMVKPSLGPPVWLAQVPLMALVDGFSGEDKVVDVGFCPPCGYHLINLGPILLVVVVDQAVGIALPRPWSCKHGFSGNAMLPGLGPF